MRLSKIVVVAVALAAVQPASADKARDLGRETLAAGDGWASLGAGTTGGSAAVDGQISTVTTRAELIAALNDGRPSSTSPSNPSNQPKIIYVSGTIDANVDDDNEPLECSDYYRDGFTLEAFLATYDPAVWGRTAPSGPLENARIASRNAQQDRVRIRVGSNTTIVGVGPDATIRGAWLDLRGTANVAASRTNIIIRNISFEDTYDCFPQWSPTDGALGSWNALYDSISLRDADHVWIDHNRFADRATADGRLPEYFGVLFQAHDGLLDITNASDLVTVSWNQLLSHDKLMLIGSSDSATADRGRLRVTLHHNLFQTIGQRAPRVRFGQVHVFNNLYVIGNAGSYQYSWGVGIESAIYAENNFVAIDESIPLDRFIERLNGSAIRESGTLVNGTSPGHAVDLLAAYNAANDPDLAGVVGWAPAAFLGIDPTSAVPAIVRSDAGTFDR